FTLFNDSIGLPGNLLYLRNNRLGTEMALGENKTMAAIPLTFKELPVLTGSFCFYEPYIVNVNQLPALLRRL
ncbi:MAG: hypothetical protein ACYSN9_06920, partial [Planctomycetota bacterium]